MVDENLVAEEFIKRYALNKKCRPKHTMFKPLMYIRQIRGKWSMSDGIRTPHYNTVCMHDYKYSTGLNDETILFKDISISRTNSNGTHYYKK